MTESAKHRAIVAATLLAAPSNSYAEELIVAMLGDMPADKTRAERVIAAADWLAAAICLEAEK